MGKVKKQNKAEFYNNMFFVIQKIKLQKNGLIINMQLEILKILIMTQEEIGFPLQYFI